jgi:hypothetical protein
MTPWDKWEVLDIAEAGWRPLLTHPTWHSLNQYRRIEDFTKVIINGEIVEFKKPNPISELEGYVVSGTGMIKKCYVSEEFPTFHATFKNIEDAENYSKVIRKVLGESV